MKLGPLHIEAGGLRVPFRGVWIPDGLHVWWRDRGVHLFWSRSKYQPRVVFDRLPAVKSATSRGSRSG